MNLGEIRFEFDRAVGGLIHFWRGDLGTGSQFKSHYHFIRSVEMAFKDMHLIPTERVFPIGRKSLRMIRDIFK